MPNDTPQQPQDPLAQLSSGDLQDLFTAVHSIKYGKVPGNFDAAKVDDLWGRVQEQVRRGPGKPADVEPSIAKTAFDMLVDPKSIAAAMIPGGMQVMGLLQAHQAGQEVSHALETGKGLGYTIGAGLSPIVGGPSASAMEAEAAKGHLKTVATMAAIPTALTAIMGAHSVFAEKPPVAPRLELPEGATPSPKVTEVQRAAQEQLEKTAHPIATPDVSVPEAPKPAPEPAPAAEVSAPTTKGVVDRINSGVKMTELSPEELRTVSQLNGIGPKNSFKGSEAEQAGLSRPDWMSAVAKVRRLDAAQEAPATPHETLHKQLTAVVKETFPVGREADSKAVLARQNTLRDTVRTVAKLTPDERSRIINSLDVRADAANRQAAEIRRVMDAADYNAEITKIRRENLAADVSRFVPGESVGFDPDTGRAVIAPEIDPETGKPVPGAKVPRFITGITQERRQLLGLLAGEEQGRWRMARDPITGEALKQPKLSPDQEAERDSFVQDLSNQLNQWRKDVLAQGGRPSEEQLSEGEKLVAGLQAATGKRFLYSGKKGLSIDEHGVATWEGIDPNRAWWNKAMGRQKSLVYRSQPVSSHFTKPDEVRVQLRLDQLEHEAKVSTQISDVLKRTLSPRTEAPKAVTLPKGSPTDQALKIASSSAKPAEAPLSEHPEARFYAERLEDTSLIEQSVVLQPSNNLAVPVGGKRVSGLLPGVAGTEAEAKAALAQLTGREGFPNARIVFEPVTERYGLEWGEPTGAGSLTRGKSREIETEIGRKLGYKDEVVRKWVEGYYGPTPKPAASAPAEKLPTSERIVLTQRLGELKAELSEADVSALKDAINHPNATPEVQAAALQMLQEHTKAQATPKGSSERAELQEALPRLQKELRAAKGKEEQARLRDTIRAYQERLAKPDISPETEAKMAELQAQRQRLARMQETGRGAGKQWNPETQKYDRPSQQSLVKQTIAQLAKDLGAAVPEPTERTVAATLGTEMLKTAPKPKADFGAVSAEDVKIPESEITAEDLMNILHSQFEEIPTNLMKNIEALHDPKSPLPREGRDFIAGALLDSESALTLPIEQVADRYFKALAVYKQALAVKDRLGLSKAIQVAKYGRLSKPGETGFVNAGFMLDMAEELGKYAKNAAVGVKDLTKMVGDWLEDGMWLRVPREVKATLFEYQGKMTRVDDLARIAFNKGIKSVRQMSVRDQLDLVYKYQTGQNVADPEIQGQLDILRQLQGKHWVEMRQRGKPDLAWWEDHVRNFFEHPSKLDPTRVRKYATAIDGALLRGDQGMFRQRHYETLLHGIADGLVPATTNIFEMHLMDLGRQAQYIAAQDLLGTLRDMGRLTKGVVAGAELLDPVPVPENIQSRWFPTKGPDGKPILGVGERWYGERADIKGISNWLQPDYVRNNVVGKALVGFKNLYTPVELMGPFHAFGTIAKAVALNVSQGVSKMYSSAMHGQYLDAAAGFQDALTALKAPYSMYKEGKALQEYGGQTVTAFQKYGYDKQNFLNSPMGQRLEKLYPGHIGDVIDAALEGGIRFDVHPDYQTKWRRAVVDSWRAHQYLKSGVQVPMAAIEAVTAPLFQKYIPALKIGAAAREIQAEHMRNADAIANGEISVETVNQRAVRRIDNILGEVNWNNFYLARWQKTLLQIGWRSPGWRLGTLDLAKNAIWGQIHEAYQAAANRRIPTPDPNLLYLASETAMGAAASAVFMNLFAHKAPSSAADLVAPQTGEKDSRGKPIRVNWPMYTKDFLQMAGVGQREGTLFEKATAPIKGTAEYMMGGQTGFLQRSKEAWANRSFEGVDITEDSGATGAAVRLGHAIFPQSFALSGMAKMRAQGAPTSTRVLSMFGVNPARRDLDMSEAEKLLSERARRTTVTRTAEQEEVLQARQRIEGSFLSGHYSDMNKYIKEAITSRILKPTQIREVISQARKPYIERVGAGLRAEDLVAAYRVATPEERPGIMRMLVPKMRGNQKAIEQFTKVQSEVGRAK